LEKGRFYKSYGDALFNVGSYASAIQKYDDAYFYLSKINSKLVPEVKTAQSESYVALADQYVDNNMGTFDNKRK
jgi:hypothetical protein